MCKFEKSRTQLSSPDSFLFYLEDSQQIKPGDKVTVKLETDTEQFYRGHVQEVSPDNGPICVFVEELGQRYTLR